MRIESTCSMPVCNSVSETQDKTEAAMDGPCVTRSSHTRMYLSHAVLSREYVEYGYVCHGLLRQY